jgi:hypothetical protein
MAVGDIVTVEAEVTMEAGDYRKLRFKDGGSLGGIHKNSLTIVKAAIPKNGIYRDRVGDLWSFRHGIGEPLTVGGGDGEAGHAARDHERAFYSKEVEAWAPYTKVAQ